MKHQQPQFRRIKSISFALCLLATLSIITTTALANCTITQTTFTTGNAGLRARGFCPFTVNKSAVGQSFIACESGLLESIEVDVSNLTGGPVAPGTDPYTGQQTTLAISAAAHTLSPDFSQTVNLSIGVNVLVLSIPFPVTAGNTYSFSLTPPDAPSNCQGSSQLNLLTQRNTNPYPDGIAFQINITNGTPPIPSSHDLKFEVQITSVAPPSAGIPTVSEWGLAILSFLFLTFATVAIRRRKTALATSIGNMDVTGNRPFQFNPVIFMKVFASILGIAVIGLVASIVLTGAVSATDVIGGGHYYRCALLPGSSLDFNLEEGVLRVPQLIHSHQNFQHSLSYG